MKALIKVGYACNEHCSFCHTQDVRHIQGESRDVERKIDRAAALGHTMVVLSGGEPTIRSELTEWAARVAAHGMDFGLVTNGLMLAYPEVLQSLLRSRLRYVYMSLHGGEAKVHERLVRADSWKAANAALDQLSGRGLDLTINCVVTRHNVEHLMHLVEHAVRWPDARVKFSACEPKGGALHLMGALVPPIALAAKRVREAIAHGRALPGARGPTFVHGGFPLCLMGEFHDAYDDLRTHAFRTMIEVDEPDFFPVDDANKCQPAECRDCRLAGACPGLFVEYYRRHGASELIPQREGVRGNAFDWVFVATLPAAPDGTCPLRVDGPTPWDRGRDLLVRHDNKLACYRADGRDFSDDAIAATKHGLGQIYLDATRKAAPDDFARDLVKLERADECRGCPHEATCTGMYEPRFEDVFTRDDVRVRELLAQLQGDVLDVGCGEGPYDDVLAPLAEHGVIQWVGLEPDADAADRAARRRPWGRVLLGGLHDSQTLLGGRQFDHVLVLRSWNHFPDPQGAMVRLAERVRSGGTLLLVDNVAFGLARSAAQQRHAVRRAPALQHYRNDDATAADAWTAGHGLRLLERRDVAPDTANQWLLRYAVP